MSIDERPEVVEEVSQVADNEQATETKVEATETKVEAPKKSFMEQALEDMVELREGKRLSCTVIEIKEDGLVVDCGQKKDGFISVEDLGSEKGLDEFSVGDEFKAKLIKSNNKEFLSLSKKNFDDEVAAKVAKEEAEKIISEGEFDLVVSKAIKGGLLGQIGDYSVFIPDSHVDRTPVTEENKEELEEKKKALVGQTIRVKKLPDKKDESEKGNRKKIVASRKNVLFAQHRREVEARKKAREEKIAREEEEKKNIFAANIDRFQTNHIVPGIVKKIVKFGAFVNVYGFTCLAPTNEISWIRDTDPATVLEVNKQYDFLITKVDAKDYKVTLSYKRLQAKPYERASEKYPVGTIVKGTVQSIVKFGAFVSIEPGIDGLVHISNISYDKIDDVASVLSVGQEIEAKVISFDENRIALSIKDLLPAPENQERRAPKASKPKTERGQVEKKPKKNEDAYESQEEKENFASYGASQVASNLAFADMLKGLNVEDSEEDK
jgi:4-hydroxy-3-methylbut-2-enyl diphosphate reductase